MISPKHFDLSSLEGGMLRRSGCVQIFLQTQQQRVSMAVILYKIIDPQLAQIGQLLFDPSAYLKENQNAPRPSELFVVVWFDGTIIIIMYYLCIVICFVLFGGLAWRLMQVYSITVDFSPI